MIEKCHYLDKHTLRPLLNELRSLEISLLPYILMARKIIHLVKDPSSIIKSLGPGDAFLHQWTGTSLRQVGYHRWQGMTWNRDIDQGPLLLTLFNFNPSMDK